MSVALSRSLAGPLAHSRRIIIRKRPHQLVPEPSPTPVLSLASKLFSHGPTRQHDTSEPHHSVRYTTDSYPSLKRDSRFAKLTSSHVDSFRSILEENAAIIDGVTSSNASDDLEPFNEDWTKKYRGHSQLVLKPKNVNEVSAVLKYCNKNTLAVVPQGGNSGLVGGGVPVFDEVVISLSRMNEIRSFDDISGVLVVDGGVILEVADNHLAEHGYIFPLDLGAKGSCQIGGNVATNAGGLRLLRYGSLRGNVLGIEAVLPDGTIVDDLSKLRKNNTGYDLKQLFIGGEGTIGITTGVSIICPRRSSSINVAYFGLSSYEHVLRCYKEARSQLGEILSAFELMDSASQSFVGRVAGLKRPLESSSDDPSQDHPFYCLVGTSGSNAEHDSAKLEIFLEIVMAEEIVMDGVLAQDETQAQQLWRWREGITEAIGYYETRERLESMDLIDNNADNKSDGAKPALGVVGYGHMGDGNLHLNILVRRYDKSVEEALEPWVYDWIQKRQGSISAEHGLGIAKKKYIGYSRNETMVRLMKEKVKEVWDPSGIMNPFKYI